MLWSKTQIKVFNGVSVVDVLRAERIVFRHGAAHGAWGHLVDGAPVSYRGCDEGIPEVVGPG